MRTYNSHGALLVDQQIISLQVIVRDGRGQVVKVTQAWHCSAEEYEEIFVYKYTVKLDETAS